MDNVLTRADRAIPARLRKQVVERDGLECRRCGCEVRRAAPGEPYRPDLLHLDHVDPWASGGEHTLENLIVCCADCNLRRPRPTLVLRSAKVRVDYRDDAYWWRDGYRPPLVADGETMDVRAVAAAIGSTVLDILREVVGGRLSATASGPIRVSPPEEWGIWPWQVEQERRRRADDYEGRKRTRQAERARARTGSAGDLDPDRVAYWRDLIEQRRARDRT